MARSDDLKPSLDLLVITVGQLITAVICSRPYHVDHHTHAFQIPEELSPDGKQASKLTSNVRD